MCMYRVLAGTLPLKGASIGEFASWIRTGQPHDLDALSDVASAAMICTMRKALAVSPDQRFQSAAEMSQELAPLL